METKIENVILEFENRVWEHINKVSFKKEFKILFEKDVDRMIKELYKRDKLSLKVKIENEKMILDNTEDDVLIKEMSFSDKEDLKAGKITIREYKKKQIEKIVKRGKKNTIKMIY